MMIENDWFVFCGFRLDSLIRKTTFVLAYQAKIVIMKARIFNSAERIFAQRTN